MASFSSGSGQEDEVLVEEKSFVRTLILNRPKQLNSASRYMISRLLELFLVYEKDSNVKLVILKGKGRAFCAGGDVAALVHDINNGNWKSCAIVSWKVFTLNYLMATYSKPQVSILNGIVMGGGAGCSIHGSLRVATENSVFAMPETALGLFPDTGASYFLSRLPGHFGEYLGLTGARVDGAEMLACGLATHFVPSAKLPSLEAALHTVDSSDKAIISAVIGQYSELPMLKEQSAYRRSDVINRCFSRRTVEDILSALIREGRLQGIGQCLVREYRMVCHGCRALLLDKDKNPKWEPPRLELVSEKMVDKYFSKVDDEDWEDLKLPARSNLPASAIAKL
ncbi:3-hydroxyisobutyryl-CoA hydrolase 1-like isoform X6 [Syzygium oleosum]|uniref:3-hydroxyisobutyryl-CoA hydrolase 1-like isoform X6 n=1 Tax=Syzygium oleosum TaxID=219896 RepID=UPI0024B8992F|nr:3-hydroxyisobutyryl-CoA hydrolase 1-like isoform X6 [Syzygium oleosum]